MTDKITLYSNHCPRCNVLITKLKAARIKYNEISDIDIMVSKGFMSMPIIEVNGEIYDFAKAITWINERVKENNGY